MISKTFKIKKPKIINITTKEYKECSCFIFVGHYVSLHNNKPIKLGLVKLFLTNTSFLILHKKYDYDDINSSLFNGNINISINNVKRIYNRNNISIYVLTIDYGLSTLTVNNTIFNETKYIVCLEKKKENDNKNEKEYNIIKKNTLSSNINTIMKTPYFTIKLKSIMATIWNC